jgi:CheY-like chemotaxis protein
MPPISLATARVLAVDDDEANLRVLRRLLQRAGCTQVETTSDPTAAEGMAERFGPDLVLLDLNMPEMDGFEVLRRLHSADGPRPRVVVLSGEDADGASTRALSGGAMAFVSKPFDANDLLSVLARVLGSESHRDGHDGSGIGGRG